MADHPMTRPMTEIVLDRGQAGGAMQKGDLDSAQGDLEALLTRLNAVASRVAYLYGDGTTKGLQSVTPLGKIPRLQATISDMSDTVGEIEQIIEKL